MKYPNSEIRYGKFIGTIRHVNLLLNFQLCPSILDLKPLELISKMLFILAHDRPPFPGPFPVLHSALPKAPCPISSAPSTHHSPELFHCILPLFSEMPFVFSL